MGVVSGCFSAHRGWYQDAFGGRIEEGPKLVLRNLEANRLPSHFTPAPTLVAHFMLEINSSSRKSILRYSFTFILYHPVGLFHSGLAEVSTFRSFQQAQIFFWFQLCKCLSGWLCLLEKTLEVLLGLLQGDQPVISRKSVLDNNKKD